MNMRSNPSNVGGSRQAQALLPDLCNNQVLLLIILIGELLAIVLTLSQQPFQRISWVYLAASSLFIQGVVLADAALLCYTRHWLLKLKPVIMGTTVYAGLQLVTVAATLLSQMSANPIEFGRPVLHEELLRNVGISAIISGVVMRYFYLRYQNQMRQDAENDARIQALQARIRPHFLFNSLNTIANLVHQQAQTAEEAILDLAELFRSTLAQPSKITLAQEMESVRRYLRIESLRLGERLKTQIELPETLLTLELPPFAVQPLVENAIYHGIEPLPGGGTISITAADNGVAVILSIRNPRIPAQATHSRGNRIALDNIRQRLQLHYGESAGLTIIEAEREYTVELTLPRA
jgi:two-component system sensor histidine kinase AlgZ